MEMIVRIHKNSFVWEFMDPQPWMLLSASWKNMDSKS